MGRQRTGHAHTDDSADVGADAGTDTDTFGARPYAVTAGRTEPSTPLDMLSIVKATGGGAISPEQLNHVHHEALSLCGDATTVVEVASRMRLPLTATKIVLADLIQLGALIARFPPPTEFSTDIPVLEAVIDGLRRFS